MKQSLKTLLRRAINETDHEPLVIGLQRYGSEAFDALFAEAISDTLHPKALQRVVAMLRHLILYRLDRGDEFFTFCLRTAAIASDAALRGQCIWIADTVASLHEGLRDRIRLGSNYREILLHAMKNAIDLGVTAQFESFIRAKISIYESRVQ